MDTEDITLTLDENEVPADIKTALTVPMLLVTLQYELAKNFFDCEEVATGQEYLEKCIEVCHAYRWDVDNGTVKARFKPCLC